MEDIDYILCECELEILEAFVSEIEEYYEITVVRSPGLCLTMLKAEDSVERQKFFLGEALTTECELIVNGKTGHGIVIGDEPVRSYCVAFIDAVMQLDLKPSAAITEFLSKQSAVIAQKLKVEYNHILRTKVDFKLMDQY